MGFPSEQIFNPAAIVGQELDAFYDAIVGANVVITSLLWCFACLAAERGLEVCNTFIDTYCWGCFWYSFTNSDRFRSA